MKVLVFGATSAIAQAACRIMAERGDDLLLAARDKAKLDAVAQDLRVRGKGKVETAVVDALDFAAHAPLVEQAERALGGLDALLVAHGTLTDQKKAEADVNYARREMDVNFGSVVSLVTPVAQRFEARGAGVICVISSVAGDRGRASNYVYGSAKAATTAFLSGLRNRLHGKGVAVVTVKPGPVDTPMTAHLKKGLLMASPEKVGRGIVRAMDRRKDVVYLPGHWRAIMFVIRHVPEFLFKRTRLEA
jgi:short-subunit dehydrogenase